MAVPGESETSFDNPWSIAGFLGGVVFALSLAPQLHKTFTTRSAKDLSYFWQAFYIVGLVGLLTYTIGYSLWPYAAPLLVEFLFMTSLTCMKVVFDGPRGKNGDQQEGCKDEENGHDEEQQHQARGNDEMECEMTKEGSRESLTRGVLMEVGG